MVCEALSMKGDYRKTFLFEEMIYILKNEKVSRKVKQVLMFSNY